MAKKQKIIPSKILQFKITSNDSSPRIWRRILVPSGYTFFDLHKEYERGL
ncbi:MAG: hypothetical protein HYV65_01000 [Candidatus Spechtbacteria bacterium]|nr:hypothetical protein [Candidatus Spechtbacteria bacterium]